MRFEVINLFNKTVMHTKHISCIPKNMQLESMSKVGYRFKLNNKIISKTKLIEYLKQNTNDV